MGLNNSAPERSSGEHELRLLFTNAQTATIAVAIQAFLTSEMAGKSPQTRLWYGRRLFAMANRLGESRAVGEVMEADLAEWYALMAKERLSAYTLHGHLRAVKRFYRWLFKKNILLVDLSICLALPKLPRGNRKGISEANLQAILEAAKDNPRDYALLMVLASTGCRRGGLANLRLDDLNLDHPDRRIRRRITVREKGNKERTVVMDEAALAALESYLLVRPEIGSDQVFLGCSPGQDWRAIKDVSISEIIDRYKRRLGLRGKCSPHEWRHRWARHRLQKGMELSLVSQLMGHEDVSTTVRFYGQFTMDQLQEAYDKFSD